MNNPELLYNALSYALLTEVVGPGSDPIILDIIQEIAPEHRDDSTYAWCSACMNEWARNCCLENTMHLRPGLARDWLKVGQHIKQADLRPGDVVIFWRDSPNGWQGHVGLFCRFSHDGRYIVVYGGNQGNKIHPDYYPTSRFLGGRRLRPDTTHDAQYA